MNIMSTQDRLGYYLVGWKKFTHKSLALLESRRTGYELKWVFNDNVFSSIDWSSPIQESIFELYRRRAVHLREKYDYLVLYYSGGADSMNILDTFIEHDIFLDEIVMQIPEPVRPSLNPHDTSGKNYYAEIEFSATPHLKKYAGKLHPNTKITYQDISKPLLELFNRDDWFDVNPIGTHLTIAVIARQVAQGSDPSILELCDKNYQVGQIVGVDKPLVWFDGEDYYFYFSDLSAMHAPSVSLTPSEVFTKFYHTEFFYWTPDLPQIVIKQAQLIKQFYEANPTLKEFAKESKKRHVGEYKSILHPIIYMPTVDIEFSCGKPSSKIVRGIDTWFWEIADKKQINNYMETMGYLRERTFSHHMIGNTIDNGIAAHLSKHYKL
jgi:hypothetical protein